MFTWRAWAWAVGGSLVVWAVPPVVQPVVFGGVVAVIAGWVRRP